MTSHRIAERKERDRSDGLRNGLLEVVFDVAVTFQNTS